MAGNVRKNLEALGCTVNFLRGEVSRKERLIDEQQQTTSHAIRQGC